MPLTKVCPECCINVNLRKSVCKYGHCFTLKRKASVNATSLRKSKRIAKQVKRASELAYETIIRQTKDHLETESETLHVQQGIALNAKKRALETDDQTFQRQMLDKQCIFKKRNLETDDQTFQRQMLDKQCIFKKRNLETDDQTFQRQMLDKQRISKKKA